MGTAINPNQVADIIRGEPMRMVYVRELVQVLSERGKYVEVEKILPAPEAFTFFCRRLPPFPARGIPHPPSPPIEFCSGGFPRFMQ